MLNCLYHYTIYMPTSNLWDFWLLHTSPTLSMISLFNFNHSDGYIMELHSNFNFSNFLLMISNIFSCDYWLFTYLCSYSVCSNLLPDFCWTVCLLIIDCRSSLGILGNSLVVQWLGLLAFTADGLGWTPGLGTRSCKLLSMAQKKKKKEFLYIFLILIFIRYISQPVA